MSEEARRAMRAFGARLEGEMIELAHIHDATPTDYWRGRLDTARMMLRTYRSYIRRAEDGEQE